ncbi:MAG: hypothetical protein RLZZ127_1572 [Planctomycetota bacterium]|jgi:hypothetical protein
MPLLVRTRITVYVPPEAAEAVLAGIHAVARIPVGATYDHGAWFSGAWTEQFRPLPGSHPASGEIGRVNRADSVRIEVLVDPDETEAVIARGIRPHHPWDIPVILLDEVRLALP